MLACKLNHFWMRFRAALGNGFYPCEMKLVEEIRRLARPEIRDRVGWQLENTRRIYHEPKGSSVLVYPNKKIELAEREKWRFSGLPVEVKWATIKFRVGSYSMTAKLSIVNGHLFSIEYNKDIRKVPDDEPLRVEKWTEHHDLSPSNEPIGQEDGEYAVGRVVSVGEAWAVEAEFKGKEFRAVLPADWAKPEWRKTAKKLTVCLKSDDEIRDEIRLVIRDKAQFFALLGDEPDFLGVPVGADDGQLYWITHEDEAFYIGESSCGESLGNSMEAAVHVLYRRHC